MGVRYIDCSVILCATTKYSEYTNRAQKIIGGIFRTPSSVVSVVRKIHKRRKKSIYPNLFTTLNISDMIEKTPLDFKSCFTIGSIGHYVDDRYLENMFEKILDDMGMYVIHKFDEERAREFRRKVFAALQHNKVQLGLILSVLENEEFIFEDEFETETKKLYSAIKKRIKDPKYKFEIQTLSQCMVHGLKSGMEFEVISAESKIIESTQLRKIQGAIKKQFGPNCGNLITPISDVW